MEQKSVQGATSQKELELMYSRFLDFEEKEHQKNLKRIKIGIRCIWIIPAIFLFLMFFTGSSKVIFLVLWICSLFGIAVYLIVVEFADYNLQHRLNEIQGNDDAKMSSLIEVPEMVENRVQKAVDTLDELNLPDISELEDRIHERREALAEHHMDARIKAHKEKESTEEKEDGEDKKHEEHN